MNAQFEQSFGRAQENLSVPSMSKRGLGHQFYPSIRNYHQKSGRLCKSNVLCHMYVNQNFVSSYSGKKRTI